MADNPNCSVFIGSLDERVTERVLYDILIQAGRVVDLYIPRDRETDKPKAFAFAQYETEEIAEYAVKLFSGLVTLYNKTLRFAISGKDKPSVNLSVATSNSSQRPRVAYNEPEMSPHNARLQEQLRFSEQYGQEMVTPPGVSVHQYRSNGYDYSRRVIGTTLDNISRFRSTHQDSRYSNSHYPSY